MSAAAETLGRSVVDPNQRRYTAVWEKRQLIDSLPETDIALDAGAANGEYVMHLLARAHRVVAVDLDPARVAQLRARFAHVRNVSVVQASVDALPFRDRAFGIVWASEIVEHLTSIEASLDEFERVSDAHLIATLPSPLGPYRYLDPTHRLRYSIGGLRRALTRRGRWEYRLEGLGGCLPQWLGLARLRSAWLAFSRPRPWAAWTLLVRGQRAPAGR